ncbi:GrpB family protein [Saccharopolyspora sp. K220]|uniref:GrpB family protein n=1 Tax=Saccharopolyspora soli TaxID=2926618 RepID=UPI001F5877A0|nr:GrpB family protein [Saccharopolyspora soli]MCI2423151.1 GrpB family protein [Saccharopolyspora soli]
MNNVPEPDYIRGPDRADRSITLVEYDPAWAAQYEREAERIRAALGSRAQQVEHAGSTSVPGLAAKPILDILLVVADSAHEAAYVSDLEAAGYALHVREPEWLEHRLLKRRSPVVNLHIFSDGCPEVDRMLSFRDHLRTHPDERDRYSRVKRELAARKWTYVQEYADAKSSVVEEIISRPFDQ